MAPWLLAWNLLCFSDAATTHSILSAGGREVTIPTQQPWAIDGVVAAQAIAVDVTALKLRKNHPKAAWALVIGMTAARGFIVAHNLRER